MFLIILLTTVVSYLYIHMNIIIKIIIISVNTYSLYQLDFVYIRLSINNLFRNI